MGKEFQFFLLSILYGTELIFVYDIIRSVRNTWKHKKILIVAEDMIFWIAAGIFLFTRLYKWNDGVIRWYFFAGVFLGMVANAVVISPTSVKFVSFLLKRLKMLFSWGNIILESFLNIIYEVLGIENEKEERKENESRPETTKPQGSD